MRMTLLFDTWGTLVDNYSIADVIEPHVYESHIAQRIAQDWRAHQKWAMFYTTLADSFVPHPGLNEACLRWALDRHHVELPEAAIQDIVNNYHKLRAYPDVINALKSLKQQGHTLKIVANPSKKMIEDHSKYAGTYQYLDEIISNGEEAKAFKPSPKVYELGIRRAGCPKENILWVTGHFWEIVGAVRQGLKCAWTNRARQPMLKIGVKPTYEVFNLLELADTLKKEGR
jgi:2-haloacid dehalogenase